MNVQYIPDIPDNRGIDTTKLYDVKDTVNRNDDIDHYAVTPHLKTCKRKRETDITCSSFDTNCPESDRLSNCPECPINETISNNFIADGRINFQNDQSKEINNLSEVMKGEIPENCDYPHVYTDTDENPVLVMTHVERPEETKTKEYKCDVCEAVFCHSSSIKEHMLQHKRSRPLHCSRCDQFFVLGGSLRAHKQQHELEDSVHCPFCSKRCKNVGSLTAHMKSHEKPELYECAICCKSFGQSSGLIKHVQSHTAAPLYECDICHERVSTLKCLEHHKMRVHHIYAITVYPYKCTICDRRFKKRSSLKIHDWKNHSSSGNLSSVRKRWQSVKHVSTTLNLHDHGTLNVLSPVSETQKCIEVSKDDVEARPGDESMNVSYNNPDFQKCHDIIRNEPSVKESKQSGDKLFESFNANEHTVENSMSSFRTVIHDATDDLMDTAVEPADDEDEESVTDKTDENGGANTDLMLVSEVLSNSGPSRYETPNSIEDHMPDKEDKLGNFIDTFVADIMGYNDEAYEGEDNGENKELKSHTCDLCSHEFEGCKAIKEHMLQHNKLTPHYCTRCDLYFVLARNMKAHLNQHEIEDPLVCQLCNEVFHTPEGLNSHSLTHVEYFPYKCGVCQRGFQTQNTYDLHMRFHSNTVFECSICHKNFSLKRDLQTHNRQTHFIYEDKKFRFGCNLCEMKFKAKTPLLDHKRYSHNIQWDELVNTKGVKHYWRHRRDKSKF